MWLVQGGFPQKIMNVYLIEDEGQVTVFDAGIRAMTNGIARPPPASGGIKRIVLGHGHADHRGAAPGLGAPVFCHPDEVEETQGDGGEHYFDFSKLDWYARAADAALPAQLGRRAGAGRGHGRRRGTTSPASRWSTFPGHAPGMIGLWRESDRLALVSDTLYTLEPADRASRARRACRTGRSTTTPTRRSRASASWRRWSRPPSGRATRIRSPATCAAQLERAADAG